MGKKQIEAVGTKDPNAVVWNSVEGKYVHETGVLGGAVVGQGGGDQSVPAGELVHAAPAKGNSGSVKESKFSRQIQSRDKSCAILKSFTKISDYDKVMYEALTKNFDWKEVDDSLQKLF